jgi:REP element-mobilizing transposase RayT
MARCVRRAYLFGDDAVSGRSFDHRKAWVEDKLAFLTSVFAIDVCAYAVMSNHYHVVLKVDVEQATAWSNQEVLDRWLQVFSGNVLVNRYVTGDEQSQAEVEKVLECVEKWRERLTDISWFMRVLNESIARMANEEDDCKGRFWEGRFKSQALLDEAAVLACMAYVDLNPVRAGIAELPEDSEFTSIQQRLKEFATRKAGRPSLDKDKSDKPESSARQKPALYPFNNGAELKDGEKALPFSLKDYAELLDWTGRAMRHDKRGSIPEQAPPILERIGFSAQRWLNFVPKVEKSFCHVIGAPEAMQALAQTFGLGWFKGQAEGRALYGGAQ